MSRLADYVRILGRGPGRSRHFTQEEARQAMGLVMAEDAAPEAVGALLMLLRYRGEDANEIAGFVEAFRESLQDDWRDLKVDLDQPSYASGRTRGLPYFLLSLKLLAQRGIRVAVHGFNSHQKEGVSVRAALDPLGLAVAGTPKEAQRRLEKGNFVYLPLEDLQPKIFELLRLREVLGLRSPINSVLRGYNPFEASASLQGVFHPTFLPLQRDAAALLGQQNLAVFKGGGGEAERNPAKTLSTHSLADGEARDLDWSPLYQGKSRRLAEEAPHLPDLLNLWQGRRQDNFAEALVVGTAAVALFTLGKADSQKAAEDLAQSWWQSRDTRL
ncbi:glycosyl transferase family protein [Rhodovibrionaceae bacterium A322]